MINHIGTYPIETERLILRKVEMSDAEQIFNNWAKDPENAKYVSWSAHKNLEETKELVSNWVSEYESQKCYRWIIVLKDSFSIIGCIDIVSLIERIDCGEIGYVLSKKYWNHGFMTEALHAVLDYLFNRVGFHRIHLLHHVDNLASGRVMQKNGLKYEGIIRDGHKTNSGSYCDVCLYSILKDEFEVS